VNVSESSHGAEFEPPRFTVTGDQALDTLISGQLKTILEDLLETLNPGKIEALVLGGGYGRGEGGALYVDGSFAPYNDYDLVLIHHYDNTNELEKTLQRMHLKHSARCKIHVDITPLKITKLKNLPHTLTWYELLQGHLVLYGNQNVLSPLGQRTLEDIPDSEWGRLLFNRGSGLLYSIWLHESKCCDIANGETFESFVTRQIEKAWLALGDTWLARRGGYDAQVIKRRDNWLALESHVPSWSEHYLKAIGFKLSPSIERSRERLTEELAILADLYGANLKKYRSSESKPLVGLYATLKNIHPMLWPLSYPLRYPSERMRLALLAELGGNTLIRERLVGSPGKYIDLWQNYA
jgi:hypothetical protein